jgi:hypothetical protein
MWAYPGSSCPNCPSPEELSVVEVEARIRMVLDSVVILSPSAGHDPLRRGITSVRVSILGPIFAAFMVLMILRRVSGMVAMSHRTPIHRGYLKVGGETCLQRGHTGM